MPRRRPFQSIQPISKSLKNMVNNANDKKDKNDPNILNFYTRTGTDINTSIDKAIIELMAFATKELKSGIAGFQELFQRSCSLDQELEPIQYIKNFIKIIPYITSQLESDNSVLSKVIFNNQDKISLLTILEQFFEKIIEDKNTISYLKLFPFNRLSASGQILFNSAFKTLFQEMVSAFQEVDSVDSIEEKNKQLEEKFSLYFENSLIQINEHLNKDISNVDRATSLNVISVFMQLLISITNNNYFKIARNVLLSEECNIFSHVEKDFIIAKAYFIDSNFITASKYALINENNDINSINDINNILIKINCLFFYEKNYALANEELIFVINKFNELLSTLINNIKDLSFHDKIKFIENIIVDFDFTVYLIKSLIDNSKNEFNSLEAEEQFQLYDFFKNLNKFFCMLEGNLTELINFHKRSYRLETGTFNLCADEHNRYLGNFDNCYLNNKLKKIAHENFNLELNIKQFIEIYYNYLNSFSGPILNIKKQFNKIKSQLDELKTNYQAWRLEQKETLYLFLKKHLQEHSNENLQTYLNFNDSELLISLEINTKIDRKLISNLRSLLNKKIKILYPKNPSGNFIFNITEDEDKSIFNFDLENIDLNLNEILNIFESFNMAIAVSQNIKNHMAVIKEHSSGSEEVVSCSVQDLNKLKEKLNLLCLDEKPQATPNSSSQETSSVSNSRTRKKRRRAQRTGISDSNPNPVKPLSHIEIALNEANEKLRELGLTSQYTVRVINNFSGKNLSVVAVKRKLTHGDREIDSEIQKKFNSLAENAMIVAPNKKSGFKYGKGSRYVLKSLSTGFRAFPEEPVKLDCGASLLIYSTVFSKKQSNKIEDQYTKLKMKP